MNIELTVTHRNVEGALIRLLGTVERRGHRLLDVQSRSSGDQCELRLGLDTGGRSADVLLRQLRRLHEVRDARLSTQAQPQRTPEAALESLRERAFGFVQPVWELAHG